MKFDLKKIKNMIFVANEFEKWFENKKTEPIEIEEEIPENLWKLFNFYLLRFCDENTTLILPPIKIISKNFIYGTFGKVVVSEKTELIEENSFVNSKIKELDVHKNTIIKNGAISDSPFIFYIENNLENSVLAKDEEEYELFSKEYYASDFFNKDNFIIENNDFFSKANMVATFNSTSKLKNLSEIKEKCEEINNYAKGKIFSSTKEYFLNETNLSYNEFYSKLARYRKLFSTNAFSEIEDDILVFNTRLKLTNDSDYSKVSRYICYAFIFHNEKGYEFICVPLKTYAYFSENQASNIPFVLDLWIKNLYKNAQQAENAKNSAIKIQQDDYRNATIRSEINARKSELLNKIGL